MNVTEIFSSIQGESSYAGLPCTFVRLSGCNLRCSYCDTAYSYDEGSEMSVGSILQRVESEGFKLVELTGGEPLLQSGEAAELAAGLLETGHTLLVETNGSVSIRNLDSRVIVIMDMKTPGSGMAMHNDYSNIEYLKPCDEVKFVICDRADYDWACRILAEYSLPDRCTVLFSPAGGCIEPRLLAGWILKDRLRVRFNLQLHKIIYGPEERGV